MPMAFHCFTEDTLMSELIHDDYRLLQVISRFGIGLGFGEHTVAQTCEHDGVHAPTFLAVVNFVVSNGRVDTAELAADVSVGHLMAYLQRSHSYFVDFRLPAIRRKLIEAVDYSASNQMAFLILKFYDDYAAEVTRHMEYENSHIHTYVQSLLEGRRPAGSATYAALAQQHEDNHAKLTSSSDELKNIITKYYPGRTDSQQLADTLMDIFIMEEDLLSHCRLEDTLFAAAVQQLEQQLREQHEAPALSGQSHGPAGPVTASELSEREKEVICHVVRGLSNKEIAARMFISTNTVMTHRRNIARKLQIHSPAGLTIYAIVNGLIDLVDVKL